MALSAPPAALRAPLVMGAFATVSGVLSARIGFDAHVPWLTWPGELFLLDAATVPVGALFAAAIALGLWMAVARARVLAVGALAAMYAWSAALHTATSIITTPGNDWQLVAACLAGGAVGAAATQLGTALMLPVLRRRSSLALTTAVGAALGLLFYVGERTALGGNMLFLFWQPAIAACIGWGLARALPSP
jgi:hypothetical protein